MEQIKFSEAEKCLLHHLHSTGRYNVGDLVDQQNVILHATGEYLKEIGFISATHTDVMMIEATLKPKGEAYLAQYPNLDDPISVDIEGLTKQSLVLQNEKLEYEKTIRRQESIIRWWQLTTAIFGFASLILAFLALIE